MLFITALPLKWKLEVEFAGTVVACKLACRGFRVPKLGLGSDGVGDFAALALSSPTSRNDTDLPRQSCETSDGDFSD